MSEGATISHPASACSRACFTRMATEAIIDDFAIFHKPVMAVAGIGIQRHIAHDADFRHCRLDGANRPADQIVLVKGLAGIGGS